MEKRDTRLLAPSEATLPATQLSAEELDRLRSYKWRYSLESSGFAPEQAERIAFLKWLYGLGAMRS